MKKYILVIIVSALLLGWISFIWSNSMQTGESSGEMSSEVTDRINEIAEPVLGEPLSEKTVRKSAHFTEYMILGIIASIDAVLVAHALSRRSALLVSLSMLGSVLLAFWVAVIDEFAIQAITEGRGPLWRDVGIDSAGAATGAALCIAVFLLTYYFAKLRKNKTNSQR